MKSFKNISLLFLALFFLSGSASADESPQKSVQRFENQKSGRDGGAVTIFQQDWIHDRVVFSQNTAHRGGAVRAAQSFVKIGDGRFEKNKASQGGAVNAWQATGVILDVDFVQNSARTGGALLNDEGKIVLNRTSFKENFVADGDGGGAIFNRQGTIVLHDADFTGNTAEARSGGAVANVQGTVIATDTDFEKNRAEQGGCVWNTQGTFVGDGTTFDSNVATASNGGALDCFQGTLVLKDCDFFDNAAPAGLGGAVSLFQAEATIAVHDGFHSLFFGNLDRNGANSVHIESHGKLTVHVDKNGILDMRDPMTGRCEKRSIVVTKKGAGPWVLGGTNRFTGPTNFDIEEGTVRFYKGGEVKNGNPTDPSATVGDGRIILEHDDSRLTVGRAGRKAELEINGDNSVQAKQIRFGKGATIRFARPETPEDEPGVLRLRGNVSLDGATLHLRGYDKNRCETIHIEGTAETVKFECIEWTDPRPGTFVILRAEQGIKDIPPRGICVRAPGFSVGYSITEDRKQLNLVIKKKVTKAKK